MRIAEMDYTGKDTRKCIFLTDILLKSIFTKGPNSLFIRVLVDKKHQLPYKVIDALVFHFIRLSNTYKARNRGETENLPVLWHQSLLAFCQRYAPRILQHDFPCLLCDGELNAILCQVFSRFDRRSEKCITGRCEGHATPADRSGN